MSWETVIGLEVHVQLLTRTKMFCGCSAQYGDPPNTNVCPVCLGLPGALPVPNEHAVRLAVRAAYALGCSVQPRSVFARKNYFYPDLPKGYQISQFEEPLATGGGLEIMSPERGAISVGITRLHLEEDAGKSFHDRFPGLTAVDLNRSGVPLIEIVSQPDVRSPAEARAYLTALKQVLRWLGVSDCNMEEGSLRVDANLSIRRPGAPLGTRTEVKNMNSFSGLERALTIERERQVALVESGGAVVQRTMTYDAAKGEVRPVRSKEESHDYRYFPEPDLPPLVLQAEWLKAERDALPELPGAMRKRFQQRYGLTPYEALVVTDDPEVAELLELAISEKPDLSPRSVVNWFMNAPGLVAKLRDAVAQTGAAEAAAKAAVSASIAAISSSVDSGLLNRQTGRELLEIMINQPAPLIGKRYDEIVQHVQSTSESEGLTQVSDTSEIQTWVAETLAAHAGEAQRYKAGEQKLMGFLVGQVMKRSAGKADPKAVSAALAKALGG